VILAWVAATGAQKRTCAAAFRVNTVRLYDLSWRAPTSAAFGRAGAEFQTQDPASEGSVVQAAVDAAAQAYRKHGIDDVEDRVRSELAARGVVIDDEIWLNELADMIRHDVPVFISDSDGFEAAPLERGCGMGI
jgi:hypothetical protein